MHLEEVLSIHRDCQGEKLNNSSKVKREIRQKMDCWVETRESIQKGGNNTLEEVKNLELDWI